MRNGQSECGSITLVGLLGNEAAEILRWLYALEPYCDEIVLVDDSSDGSSAIAREYIKKRSLLSAFVSPAKLRIVEHSLAGDYALARNIAHDLASHDWLLHIDMDERLDQNSLSSLPELISDLERRGMSICGFPRINMIDGVVVNDLPRSEWTSTGLSAAMQYTRGTIRHLDIQFRLLQRRLRWTRNVHEMPEPILKGSDIERWTVYRKGWIQHSKSLRQQAMQDARYQHLAGRVDVHGQWDPEALLGELSQEDESCP